MNYSTLKPARGSALPILNEAEIAEPVVNTIQFHRAVVRYCAQHGPYAVYVYDHIDGVGCPICDADKMAKPIGLKRRAA